MTMDPAAAARSAAQGAGWASWPGGRTSEVEGADALDLLSRLSTQDLSPLARGRGVTSVFLNADGRVLHRALLQPLTSNGVGLLWFKFNVWNMPRPSLVLLLSQYAATESSMP